MSGITGLMYEYRTEPMNSDGDALKQECHLACIAGSGTQPPNHISEKLQRGTSYYHHHHTLAHMYYYYYTSDLHYYY